jgi:hypothetical protein
MLAFRFSKNKPERCGGRSMPVSRNPILKLVCTNDRPNNVMRIQHGEQRVMLFSMSIFAILYILTGLLITTDD